MNNKLLTKGEYKVLKELTGEIRPDVALNIALKRLIVYQKEEAEKKKEYYEDRYKMDFVEFEKAWKNDAIKNKYSYEVETDYAEWETTITDLKKIEEIEEWLI